MFKVGMSDLVASHIRYADDTLRVTDPTLVRWIIKVILWGFELASGLRVNIYKSSVIGVNMDPIFLISVGELLNCEIENISFKYVP